MSKQDIGTVYVLLTFALLLTPFGLLWRWTFRRLRSDIRTVLNYSVFILFSLIGLYTYFALIGFIGFHSGGQFGTLLGTTGYVVTILCAIPIAILAILTILQTIVFFLKRRKRSKTE